MSIIRDRTALLRTLQSAAAVVALTLTCAAWPAVNASATPAGEAHSAQQARALKITVLVTNLAGDPRAGDNAGALHVDLSGVEDVVLSPNHWDHVGGLMTLRREFARTNPRAMSRVHGA
jgi:glyoxylase-like metal-dependent hydrolase (beta-lactamase superfamily II)